MNLDEAQALLGKRGVQCGATNTSPSAQRPPPPRLSIPSQKPNGAPQAMMVDSRPATTSRRPAVWASSTQQGYGVHVPGSGAFRVETLKEAKDLLDKHGIAFDAPGATIGGPSGRLGAPPQEWLRMPEPSDHPSFDFNALMPEIEQTNAQIHRFLRKILASLQGAMGRRAGLRRAHTHQCRSGSIPGNRSLRPVEQTRPV